MDDDDDDDDEGGIVVPSWSGGFITAVHTMNDTESHW